MFYLVYVTLVLALMEWELCKEVLLYVPVLIAVVMTDQALIPGC